jgi:hypothetical protein
MPDGISKINLSPNEHDVEKTKDPDGAGAPELAEMQELRFVTRALFLHIVVANINLEKVSNSGIFR